MIFCCEFYDQLRVGQANDLPVREDRAAGLEVSELGCEIMTNFVWNRLMICLFTKTGLQVSVKCEKWRGYS